jgi:hypothetical protein
MLPWRSEESNQSPPSPIKLAAYAKSSHQNLVERQGSVLQIEESNQTENGYARICCDSKVRLQIHSKVTLSYSRIVGYKNKQE